jgi:uncharacterized membrane protein HdeD (DUF308 family)
MRIRSAGRVITVAIVMVTGVAVMITGGEMFLTGAPIADQTGNSSLLDAGALLLLLGFFLLFTPPATLAARILAEKHRQYAAWIKTLTPQERLAVHLGEAAAAAGTALAVHEFGERQRERTQQLSDAIDESARRAVQEQEPGQYQPNASS